jgi:hypothetical protein
MARKPSLGSPSQTLCNAPAVTGKSVDALSTGVVVVSDAM